METQLPGPQGPDAASDQQSLIRREECARDSPGGVDLADDPLPVIQILPPLSTSEVVARGPETGAEVGAVRKYPVLAPDATDHKEGKRAGPTKDHGGLIN